MKRRLLIIAICLLAGAVVNVAVAWGCFWFLLGEQGSSPQSRPVRSVDTEWWVEQNPEEVPDALASLSVYRGTGLDIIVYEGEDKERFLLILSRPRVSADRFLVGLPVRSLETTWWWGAQQQPAATTREPWFLDLLVVLAFFPLTPRWPGFAINTLFYATILWLLIHGPFALRRLLRVRRGRCPKCAYPMGESAVCTECGKPLVSRSCVA